MPMYSGLWFVVVGVFVVGAGILIYCGATILDGRRRWRIPHRPKSRFENNVKAKL